MQQQDGQEFIVALVEALKEVISEREMDQHEALLLVGTDKIRECRRSPKPRNTTGTTWRRTELFHTAATAKIRVDQY